MKSSSLFLVTLATVLVTGFVMAQAGGHHLRSGRLGPRHAELTGPTADPFTSEAASRYRHCQASHWRACLLQH